MLPTLEQLGIYQLTPDERIVLAQEILESVIVERGERSLPLSAEVKQMIDERLAAYESNPGDVVTWEQVKADAYARFKS